MLKKTIISGQKIRQRRQNLEMSQEALAYQVGTIQPHIQKLERDQIKLPSFNLIYLVAKALNIKMEELVK